MTTGPQENLKRGVELAREGRYDEALSIFENFIESFPSNTEALYLAGACHFKKGHHEEARRLWNKVLELSPGHAKARSMLSRLPGGETQSPPTASPAETSSKPKTAPRKKTKLEFRPWMKGAAVTVAAVGVVAFGYDMYSNPGSYSFLKKLGVSQAKKPRPEKKPTQSPSNPLADRKPIEPKKVDLRSGLPGRWFFKYEGKPATLSLQPNGKATVEITQAGNVRLTLDGTYQVEGDKIRLDLMMPNPQGPPVPQQVRLFNAVITGSKLQFNINDPSGPRMLATKQ